MRRWSSVVVPLAAILAIALLVPVSPAATKRTQRIEATVQASAVGSTEAGGAIVAGTVADPRFGDGATVYRTSPPENGVARSTFTTFFDEGTFRGTASVRSTPQPDRSTRLDGTGRITGGTGRYRGAKGSFTIDDGRIAPDGHITFVAKGRVRYGR